MEYFSSDGVPHAVIGLIDSSDFMLKLERYVVRKKVIDDDAFEDW